jgi:hypothetical protein
MLRIAIIVGSTRPNRRSPDVAKWVLDLAKKRGDATYEIVDIADFDLPVLDEAMPPSMGQYAHGHTKRWSETVASYDGYVFITPEYNHSISGALKNAIDFVYHEWTNKAAGLPLRLDRRRACCRAPARRHGRNPGRRRARPRFDVALYRLRELQRVQAGSLARDAAQRPARSAPDLEPRDAGGACREASRRRLSAHAASKRSVLTQVNTLRAGEAITTGDRLSHLWRQLCPTPQTAAVCSRWHSSAWGCCF